MSKQKRQQRPTPIVKSGEKETLGKFTVKCPLCHERGLVIMYNYVNHEIDFVCDHRESADGRNIPGCKQTVYNFPLSKYQFHQVIADPFIQENFFILRVFDDEAL